MSDRESGDDQPQGQSKYNQPGGLDSGGDFDSVDCSPERGSLLSLQVQAVDSSRLLAGYPLEWESHTTYHVKPSSTLSELFKFL